MRCYKFILYSSIVLDETKFKVKVLINFHGNHNLIAGWILIEKPGASNIV